MNHAYALLDQVHAISNLKSYSFKLEAHFRLAKLLVIPQHEHGCQGAIRPSVGNYYTRTILSSSDFMNLPLAQKVEWVLK